MIPSSTIDNNISALPLSTIGCFTSDALAVSSSSLGPGHLELFL